MSNRLIDKIRKSRETQIDVDGMCLTIRRPTVSEFPSENAALLAVRKISAQEATQADVDTMLGFVADHVIGWNATELMLYSGGTGEAAPFSREIFHEWLINSDGDIWGRIYSEIVKSAEVAAEKEGDIVKN